MIVSATSLTISAQKRSTPDPVPVFITSAGAAGFTDPSKDNQDTVKDL
jgi:hypothetical protein